MCRKGMVKLYIKISLYPDSAFSPLYLLAMRLTRLTGNRSISMAVWWHANVTILILTCSPQEVRNTICPVDFHTITSN